MAEAQVSETHAATPAAAAPIDFRSLGRAAWPGLVVAALLRGALFVQTRSEPLAMGADRPLYDELARALASGRTDARLLFASPLYPQVLNALSASDPGADAAGLRLVQAGAGLVTAIALVAIALRSGAAPSSPGSGPPPSTRSRERVARIAGLLFAGLGSPLFLETQLYPTSLATALLFTGVALWPATSTAPRPSVVLRTLCSGAALGVSILLAQGLLLVVPALLLLARPRSWRLVALAVIPLALALAANAVRNHAIEPGFHPLGANGGVTLAHGNDLGSAGRYSPLPGSDATKRHQHIQARATAEAELGRELSWSEVDGYWRSRTLRGLAGDPLGAARLWLAKLWRFTTADYLSLDTSLGYARSRAPVLYAAPLGFHVVALLAIGALSGAAARRGWPRPIAAVVAATLATCLLFFPDERYRMAATLALCVPAAFGLHALLRSTPWRRAAFGASFVALVLFDLVGSRDLGGDLVAATNHASNLEWSGRKAAALTLYQQEYAAHPRLGAARGVARLLLETQQQEAALAYLDDALERFPRDASLHNERGVALERSGDTAAARAEFRSALAAAATLPEPHLNLARLAADAGSPARAVQHYRAYVRMVPESQRGWFGLARELFRSRAPADRVRPPLARALELAAGNTARLAQAHHLEGLLLERSGDPAGAVRAYDRAVELDPDFAAPRRHRERARSAAAAPTPRPDGGARNFEARE